MPQPNMQGFGYANVSQPQGFANQNQPYPPGQYQWQRQPQPPRQQQTNVRLSSVQIPVEHVHQSLDNSSVAPQLASAPISNLLVEPFSPEPCDQKEGSDENFLPPSQNITGETHSDMAGNSFSFSFVFL